MHPCCLEAIPAIKHQRLYKFYQAALLRAAFLQTVVSKQLGGCAEHFTEARIVESGLAAERTGL
jgi:hypothetical protein